MSIVTKGYGSNLIVTKGYGSKALYAWEILGEYTGMVRIRVYKAYVRARGVAYVPVRVFKNIANVIEMSTVWKRLFKEDVDGR